MAPTPGLDSLLDASSNRRTEFTHWCGDGKLDAGECCDAGVLNGTPDSHCSKNCTCIGWCGDGHVDKSLGETCDLGPLNGK